MTTRWKVSLLCFFLFLPFIHRAWLFDDPSVIESARAAIDHPFHPYDYTLDLAYPNQPNWPRTGTLAYTHPPLSAWMLGAWMRVAGENEIALHAFMFLLLCVALFSVAPLAEYFGLTGAVWILALSPAVFLSGLTLYPHVFYFLFVILALRLAFEDRAQRSWRAILLGLILLCAALSLHQWPLLIIELLIFVGAKESLTTRQAFIQSFYFLVRPLFLFGFLYACWAWWETRLYGAPHIWATFSARATSPSSSKLAYLLPFVFLSGALPQMMVGWPLLWRKSRPILIVTALSGLLITLLFCLGRGGFSVPQAALFGLLFSTSLAFLVHCGLSFSEAPRSVRLLILWLAIEFLFIERFLRFPTGHHLLTIAIPISFLAMQGVLELGWTMTTKRLAWTSLAVFTLALAFSDQETARFGREFARAHPPSSGSYYWGNSFSGYSYYLKRNGWKPWDMRRTATPGDQLVVVPNLNTQGPPYVLRQAPFVLSEKTVFNQRNPLRTFSIMDAAGWYSASWGALPFSFSTNPAATFLTFTVGAQPQARDSASQS